MSVISDEHGVYIHVQHVNESAAFRFTLWTPSGQKSFSFSYYFCLWLVA